MSHRARLRIDYPRQRLYTWPMTKTGLRHVISQAGTTNVRVAEKLGINASTISKYDAGTLQCPAAIRYALAYVLGCRREDIDRALLQTGGEENDGATAPEDQDRGTATTNRRTLSDGAEPSAAV